MTIQYLPPPRTLPQDRLAVMRAGVELLVSTEPLPPKRRWRGRKYFAGLGAGVILVAGGGTALAWAYLHPRAVTDKTQARCYSDDTYTPDRTFNGSTVATADSPTLIGRVQNALDSCAALWQAGVLQPGALRAIADPTPSSYPVPALVGCTLPNGIAAVFPGTASTCDRVGLAPQLPAATRASQAPASAVASPATASPP
jgi:hypothetical protein